MKTRQIVHDILRDYPISRNSDEELLLLYERKFSTEATTQDFIENHFDFIRDFIRERARIQNKLGLYRPSEGVERARRKKEERIVEAIREEKKSFTSNIYNYAKRIIRNK